MQKTNTQKSECSSLFEYGDGDFNKDKKYVIQVGDSLGFIAYF